MPGSVLVTRPEPGATRTAARLRDLGYAPVCAPFLSVRRLQTPLPPPGRLHGVIAASGNALALPAAYHGLPLLAVGDATAASARAAGFTDVRSAGGDAADLARLAAHTLPGTTVLLATARGEGRSLAALLRAAGLRVRRRAVYAATPVRSFPPDAAHAIQAGLHAALFFSAATAASFARLLPAILHRALHATRAIAIGPAAAAAIRHLPWAQLHVAVQPNHEGVLASL